MNDSQFLYGLFPWIRERWNGNQSCKWVRFRLGVWAAFFEDK